MSNKCKPSSEMSTKFNSISDISPEKESWIIIARVIRLWVVSYYSKQKLPLFMEIVLMDDKGDKIHAFVRKTLIYKFQRDLCEGSVYLFQYFGVAANGGSYKTCCHTYKLNFQFTTKVGLVENSIVGFNIYDFVPISVVTGGGYDSDFLVDVMGMMTGVGIEKEYERNGTKTKLNVIALEADGHKIQCTLFGTYADQLNTFLAGGDVQNDVVIVQLGKVKTFQERIHIQNCLDCTKIIFNPVCDETMRFKQRLTDNMDSPTQVLSQLTDGNTVGMSEDFLHMTPRKTIEELKDCNEESPYVVLATVKHVIDDDDWWYTTGVYNKGVYADSKLFFCGKCNKHVMKVVPRCQIKVRLIDNIDFATFVIFDRDATLFFNNKSAANMFEAREKSYEPGSFPKEISYLVDKSFLFKVELKNSSSFKFEQSFRVKKVCIDNTIINKFNELLKENVDLNSKGRFLGNGKETITQSSIGLAQNMMPKFSCGIPDNESQFEERLSKSTKSTTSCWNFRAGSAT